MISLISLSLSFDQFPKTLTLEPASFSLFLQNPNPRSGNGFRLRGRFKKTMVGGYGRELSRLN